MGICQIVNSGKLGEAHSVSAVVVNYNVGRFLAECIRAALPQASEVLVVDNASSDSSVEGCARQFADEPKLKIIRNDANLGFAAACNIGFSQANGDFVLFLNPDCRLDEGAVSEMMPISALWPPAISAFPRPRATSCCF